MLLTLSNVLDVPLRERNLLLLETEATLRAYEEQVEATLGDSQSASRKKPGREAP